MQNFDKEENCFIYTYLKGSFQVEDFLKNLGSVKLDIEF